MEQIQKKILNDIVTLEGKCASANRCRYCPFSAECLPEFISDKGPPSRNRRKTIALDTIVNLELLDDHVEWKKKEL